MNKPITSFQNEYRFLSNFYFAPVKFIGIVYPTVEHAYQAAKTNVYEERMRICRASSPEEAKRMGKTVTMRSGWEWRKPGIMWDLLEQKFDDSLMKEMLLETGDQELIEGNNWNDKYWGAVWNGSEWDGQNILGQMLMQIRNK